MTQDLADSLANLIHFIAGCTGGTELVQAANSGCVVTEGKDALDSCLLPGGSARLGSAQLGSARLGLAWLDPARLSLAQLGVARQGVAWCNLAAAVRRAPPRPGTASEINVSLPNSRSQS